MEKLRIKRINLLLGFVQLTLLVGCISSKLDENQHCFDEQIDHILQTENEAKIHTRSELLLVLNFFGLNNEYFKAAVIPKSIYPSYLNQVSTSNSKGFYTIYDDLITLVYSEQEYPKFLSLKEIGKDMEFMIPAPIKKPKEGNPPFPPSGIEPEIYTFQKKGSCYELMKRTMADELF